MTSASLPELDAPRWYADKVERYGYDHRGLGFRSRFAQERRFEALLKLGDFNGRRILDVGCGFGDLLPFLEKRGIHPVYTGIDICEPMIRHCRERFAASAGRFAVADVLEYEPDGPYDYVVASGIFGLEAPGARERIWPTIQRMLSWASVGAAANFLSDLAPDKVPARVYVNPPEALDEALRLTPAAALDHTYLPNDFTLYLHRQRGWEKAKDA